MLNVALTDHVWLLPRTRSRLSTFFLLIACLTSYLEVTTGNHELYQPFNPRLWSFSSYQGAVVNLTYTDSGIQRLFDVFPIGSLRYPGGSIANNWNLTSGRWYNVTSMYANRTASFPEGTFTPKAMMAGLGKYLFAPPIWNLNIYSFEGEEMLMQLDALADMGVPVAYLELGNELAGGCADPEYLTKVRPVVEYARKKFPHARIGIIGQWHSPGYAPQNWSSCATALNAHSDLFDDVTVHQYAPANTSIVQHPRELWEAYTIAMPWADLAFQRQTVQRFMGPNVTIWLDEFNWGGAWIGNLTWPNRTRGSLRGLLHTSYILSAINQGPIFSSLNYYSLLYQSLADWSHWASCAQVSDYANDPNAVGVDANLQVNAHFSAMVLRQRTPFLWMGPSTNIHSTAPVFPVPIFGTQVPCIVGACFWTNTTQPALAYALLNVCNHTVVTAHAKPDGMKSIVFARGTAYGAGSDANTFQPLSSINTTAFPWQGGPAEYDTLPVSDTGSIITASIPPTTLLLLEPTSNSHAKAKQQPK
eukprot:m.71268 g.71268  ORF g.71268 m.71268 type:complete len:531 (-) comp12292_c0_seq1:1808-3400(-)